MQTCAIMEGLGPGFNDNEMAILMMAVIQYPCEEKFTRIPRILSNMK